MRVTGEAVGAARANALLAPLAAQYGLELVEDANFHDFFNQNIDSQQNRELLKRMYVLNAPGGDMPKEMWEVAYVYKIVVFRKKG